MRKHRRRASAGAKGRLCHQGNLSGVLRFHGRGQVFNGSATVARRSNPMGRMLRAPSCECLMMKLESLKVSDRSALLPGSSFGLSDVSEGGART